MMNMYIEFVGVLLIYLTNKTDYLKKMITNDIEKSR